MVLTFDAVDAELGRLVEEFGPNYHPGGDSPKAYANGSCIYMNGSGAPVCLIGHVIARLDPRAFARLADVNTQGIWGLTDEDDGPGVVEVDSYATHKLLVVAQSGQDAGAPWGAALDTARRAVVRWREEEEGDH